MGTTFDDLKRRHGALLSEYRADRLGYAAFQDEVAKLRLQDTAGVWWQVDPQGEWQKWDGTRWASAVPADAPPAGGTVSQDGPAAGRAPGTYSLAGLLALFLRTVVRSLPRKLAVLTGIVLVVWVLHTYILVRWNNGYWKVTNEFYGSILSLKGRAVGGILVWLLLSSLVTSVVRRVRAHRLRGFKTDWVSTRALLSGAFSRTGPRAAPLVLAGMAAGVIVCAPWDNRVLSILLTLLVLLALTRGPQSWTYVVSRLVWSDLRRLRGSKAIAAEPGPDKLSLVFLGFAAGCLLASLLPYLPTSGYVAFLMLGVAATVLFLRPTPATTTGLWLLLAGGLALLGATRALAHDGGVIEAGGWGNWLRSEGALRAALQGLAPAVAAALGSLLAQLDFGDQFSGFRLPSSLGGFLGGPDANRFTEFDRGSGSPGQCSRFGLPEFLVNTATLNLVVQDTLFGYEGVGPGVDITLTYNSASDRAGAFGRGWSFTYDSVLTAQGDSVFLQRGSGAGLEFRAPAWPGGALNGLEYLPMHASGDRLLRYADHWLLFEKGSGFVFRYEGAAPYCRLAYIYDRNGNVLCISRGADARPAALTDAAGRATLLVYEAGRCVRISLCNGRSASLAYDAAGSLIEVMDFMGVKTSYEYDASGRLALMSVGPDRKTTLFSYTVGPDGARLAAVTDACGNTTTYQVVSHEPRTVRVVDPEGRSTLYHSREGRTERVVDPLGNEVVTEYAHGLPVSRRDDNGATTRFEYDARGNLVRETDALGYSVAFTYDGRDNVVGETDALGEVWGYVYDERGNVVRARTPMGYECLLSYDARGRLHRVTDGLGVLREWTHDRFGNVVQAKDSLGRVWQLGYDEAGFDPVELTDPRALASRLDYDANRRVTRVTNADGSHRDVIYDCCARILESDENGSRVGYDRDPLLHVVRRTDSSLSIQDYQYDRTGNLIRTTDALGRATTIHYDGASRPVRLVDPAGYTTTLEYDRVGNLTGVLDPFGGRTTLSHDDARRVVGIRDALGSTVRLERDARGRLTTATNARGTEIRVAYDGDGFVTGRWYNGTKVAAYAYGARGDIVRVEDASGVTEYGYDLGRQLTDIRYPGGFAVGFSYDEAGNESSIEYPGDLRVAYTYDARNRPVSAGWNGCSVACEYDAAGHEVTVIRSNGAKTAVAYDRVGRVARLQHILGSETYFDAVFKRDALGNLVEETRSSRAGLTDGPEAAGVTCAYDAGNRLVRCGEAACTHDVDGNLTSVDAMGFAAGYDPENRMVENTVGGITCRHTYDAFGRRSRVESGEGLVGFHYDRRGRLLFETDENGRVSRCYVYLGSKLVAMVAPDDRVYFYHFDERGSTIALSDASGRVVAEYSYDPFGYVTARTDVQPPNRFTFVGREGVVDDGRGLYLMGRRHYHAGLGRFLQKDPLGPAGGVNPYAYVGNNPLNMIDPSGLQGDEPWTAWGEGTYLVNVGWGVGVAVSGVVVVAGATAATPVVVVVGGVVSVVMGGARAVSALANREEYAAPGYGPEQAVYHLIPPIRWAERFGRWMKEKSEELAEWQKGLLCQ